MNHLNLPLNEEPVEALDDSARSDAKATRKKRSPAQTIHVLNLSNDPSKVRLPRIPAEDLRRKYPTMLMNVLNSMDLEKLVDFFQTFAHDQTILKRQVLSSSEPFREIQSYSFYGTRDLLLYLHLLNVQGPDRVIQMKGDASIITRSDTFRTEIVFDFSVHSSYLYQIEPSWIAFFFLEANEKIKQLKRERLLLEADDLQSCADLFTEQLQIADESASQRFVKELKSCVSELEKLFKETFPRLEEPREITFDGKMILIVNNIYEQEQIDEIIMQSHGLRKGRNNLE